MPAQKLSHFLDPNLSELMNQQNGEDFEEATSEALRVNIELLKIFK